MSNTENGNKGYLIGIVMVAVLGGLLFGYDTAVISGAEKGLQAFFMEAKDFAYTDRAAGRSRARRSSPERARRATRTRICLPHRVSCSPDKIC